MPGWHRRSPQRTRGPTRIKNGRPKPKANRGDHLRWFPGPPGVFEVLRKPPGRQRYHPAGAVDIYRFVRLIPDWKAVSRDLDGVVLCPPRPKEYPDAEGLYGQHAIILFSWPRDLVQRTWYSFCRHFPEAARLLSLREQKRGRSYAINWSPSQARAYVLLFVLLHELGHHVDWLLHREGYSARRGESFAEDWAADCRRRTWAAYVATFGEVRP